MGQCAFCKAELELQDSANVPICVRCSIEHQTRRTYPASAQEIRVALIQELVDATVREASDELDTALSQFPGGLPHPDGSQVIQRASCKLNTARKEMGRAHSRLNDFLDRGIIPADLRF